MIFRRAKYIFLAVFPLLLLSGCGTAKFLKEGQSLVRGNEIKFKDSKGNKVNVKGKNSIKAELTPYFQQVPNRKFLFVIPREWFWFATQGPGDTTSFDRFQRRVIAEKPAIYDEGLAKKTAENMTLRLQSLGYFDAKVIAEDYFKGKRNTKAYVDYFVNPGRQYYIDSVTYTSTDHNILWQLEKVKDESRLKPGEEVNLDRFEEEKLRISSYLRNNGYAFFYPNYFEQLVIDTLHPDTAKLIMTILPPFQDSLHKAYRIGQIHVFTDFDPARDTVTQSADTLINGYYIHNGVNGGKVRPGVILDAIQLKPGDLFSQENFDKSNKQLGALNVFRFVRIKQEVDTIRPNTLNFRVELTPNFKMEMGADFEVNFTNRDGVSGAGNLFGFAVHPTFKNRNLFNGAEQLQANLSTGVEVNFKERPFWNTVDIRLQTDLYTPRFRDFLGIWRGLNSIPFGKNRHVLSNFAYDALKDNSVTRTSASYNYILILNWYRYNLFNASYGYDVQLSNTQRMLINHMGIDLLIPKTEAAFEKVREENGFLKRSFGPQLFVSLLFRDFSYIHSGRQNRFGESNYFSFSAEMAGAEIWAANAVYNEFSLKPETWRIADTINFSQYLKLEGDFRYYRQLTQKNSVACRVNLGIARPFGFTSDVPYVKQFYVGGPNSIRAWAPRGLGPGGYQDVLALNPDNNLRLYQTGDLKFEMNLEYRFEILWRLKGALFLDAGNIWTLRPDPERAGSQFLLKGRKIENSPTGQLTFNDPFYKQIAVGGGFGFRFDFSYFIFRLDMAVKLRNSFPRNYFEGKTREWDYWEDLSGFGFRKVAFNFGLGYPF